MIYKAIDLLLSSPRFEKVRNKAIQILKLRLGNKYYVFRQFILQQTTLFFVREPQAKTNSNHGSINFASHSTICGWIVDRQGKPIRNLKLELDYIETAFFRKDVFRKDIIEKFSFNGCCGFELQFNRDSYKPKSYQFALFDADTGAKLFSSQIKFKTKNRGALKGGVKRSDETKNGVVDIIIPVYADKKVTLDCINSVLAAKTIVRYRIIIVNDCSPEPELSKVLRSISSASEQIEIIENKTNQGFVKSVNLGMNFSELNNVLLLNSDTVVSDGWLDKMLDAAYSEEEVATVTALSNNATIFSLPIFNPDVNYPEAASIEVINTFLEKYNRNKTVEIPTAHGFCMFIKRRVLKEIGLFDDKKWGRGYAEENDFSLKAILAGYKNVAACDVYVKHVGSVSFGNSAHKRIRKNLAKLSKIYPEYLPTIAEFIAQDPLRSVRMLPNIALLMSKRNAGSLAILHVIHSLGGGTEHAMNTMMQTVSEQGVQTYVLRAIQGGKIWRLENYPKSISIEFDILNEKEILDSFLLELSIHRIHYHQLLEFCSSIRCLPKLLKCEYDVSLHDYYLICPRVNLLKPNGILCEGPELDRCTKCVNVHGCHPANNRQLEDKKDVEKFWYNNRQFMQGAKQLIAPTKGVANLFNSVYQGVNLIVRAHPEKKITRRIRKLPKSKMINVAILGAIGEHKGALRLRSILKYAKDNKLPIKFVLFGYGSEVISVKTFSNLVITGQYEHVDLPKLVSNYQCDRALFLSPWPETFSYTLSEAFQLGLYPFALDLGAFADRIPSSGFGTLIPLFSSDESICKMLVSRTLENKLYTDGIEYADFKKDYYKL